MTIRRPRVALDISTRLFRDALTRALAPHVDVAIVPERDAEHADWAGAQDRFDLMIVSGTHRIIDIDADLIVELPVAEGGQAAEHDPREATHQVRTLEELLELIPVSATPR